MFTQVLGIMTSLVITSHSKEMPFVLLHSQATEQRSHISSRVTSTVLSASEIFLMEDVILPELVSDNLSNVPEDIVNTLGTGVANLHIYGSAMVDQTHKFAFLSRIRFENITHCSVVPQLGGSSWVTSLSCLFMDI
jgi:hypothetical protein